MDTMKDKLEDEEFTSALDAKLHRAILAKMRLQASLVGLMGFIAFIFLLGEWNSFGFINWHLLAAIFPLNLVYKDWKSVKSTEREYHREKSRS